MPTIYETDSLDEAIDIVQNENKVIKNKLQQIVDVNNINSLFSARKF